VAAQRELLAWLDHVPLIPLAVGALFLGLAPFSPEPHLLQKMKMLAAGQLTRPLDIFDLVMHAALPLLLVLKLARRGRTASQPPAG
jgi:hypothetical protein